MLCWCHSLRLQHVKAVHLWHCADFGFRVEHTYPVVAQLIRGTSSDWPLCTPSYIRQDCRSGLSRRTDVIAKLPLVKHITLSGEAQCELRERNTTFTRVLCAMAFFPQIRVKMGETPRICGGGPRKVNPVSRKLIVWIRYAYCDYQWPPTLVVLVAKVQCTIHHHSVCGRFVNRWRTGLPTCLDVKKNEQELDLSGSSDLHGSEARPCNRTITIIIALKMTARSNVDLPTWTDDIHAQMLSFNAGDYASAWTR